MKNVIGTVRIYPSTQKGKTVRLYFPKKVVLILGSSIVFDLDTLKIRRAGIDDEKTFTIGKLHTSVRVEEPEEYYGEYDLIQRDEDSFILKKQKCQKMM